MCSVSLDWNLLVMSDYIKISWTPEVLAKIGMLNMGYPVPIKEFERFVAGEEFQLDWLLYWLQDYSAMSPGEWLECEPAILRLSELIAPHENNPDHIIVEGDNWYLQIGLVDLTREIVTIQRGGYLIAAIQNAGNGRLMVSVYRPLDSKSTNYLISLALNPAADGTVCMRPNNWEYALDCSAGAGNMYAADEGNSYLSYWEFGLGIGGDGCSRIEDWYSQRDVEPIAAKYSVMQIGNCYEKMGALELDSESQAVLEKSAADLISDFYKVAKLSGIDLPADALSYELLLAPHLPPSSLPKGKIAVYVFSWNGKYLKVGKVGPKSQARFTSHHYNSKSSNSNLSKSLLKASEDMNIAVTDETVGGWLKGNVDRVNFLLDDKYGMMTLSLLEAFLHCRLRPRFEGFESQR